jgi:hypothetical protein
MIKTQVIRRVFAAMAFLMNCSIATSGTKQDESVTNGVNSRLASSIYDNLRPSPGPPPVAQRDEQADGASCTAAGRKAVTGEEKPRFGYDCSYCSGHYQAEDPFDSYCLSWWTPDGTEQFCYTRLTGGWGTQYSTGSQICYLTTPEACSTCRKDHLCPNP